jgi:hypothetical protein
MSISKGIKWELKDAGEINNFMRNRRVIQPSQYSLGNTFPAVAEERRPLSPTVWLLKMNG